MHLVPKTDATISCVTNTADLIFFPHVTLHLVVAIWWTPYSFSHSPTQKVQVTMRVKKLRTKIILYKSCPEIYLKSLKTVNWLLYLYIFLSFICVIIHLLMKMLYNWVLDILQNSLCTLAKEQMVKEVVALQRKKTKSPDLAFQEAEELHGSLLLFADNADWLHSLGFWQTLLKY